MPKVPQKYAKSSKIRLFSPIFPFFDPTDAIFLFDFWPKNRFAAQAIDFFDFFFEKFRFPPIFGPPKNPIYFSILGVKNRFGQQKKVAFFLGFFFRFLAKKSIFFDFFSEKTSVFFWGDQKSIFFDFFSKKNSIFFIFRQKIDFLRFLGSKMDIFFVRFGYKIHFRWGEIDFGWGEIDFLSM